MAWVFRRRIKVIPCVHLNFSRSGVSTSIGVRGANINVGSSGVHLNTGIPGLGIYNRQRISGSNTPNSVDPTLPLPTVPMGNRSENIYSADIHEITSQGMHGIKEAILLAREQRLSLARDLSKIKFSLTVTRAKQVMSYVLLYGLIKKDILKRISDNMITRREAIRQTKEQMEASYVKFDIDFGVEQKQKYDALVTAFINLTKCRKIWDITKSHYEDRAVTRSSASTVVQRTMVHFRMKSIPEFRSNIQALYFQNANGADLYIYPSFVVMYSKSNNFALIVLNELDFQQSAVRFTETQSVPADATVIDRTWAKVNKNGSRDKRFKGNYQIPVVQYGHIKLRTATGVNEEYKFSNHVATETFGNAFRNYPNAVGLS
ncbi:DUF4236 domain-containing protein [Sphingobacterium bambusae]|uniref:DUF4236 domain-containing protein n=1 Tax=Sphingobacterium bambusae TaxID=662858 RepID=A0ABW6BL78_9SPHI|nr:DUF4236 domain-containing protein [Sphingobacterium bambusae]WPL51039.1 DUF4236 domain-containing protein [Sphingobacterium bambusae]